MEPSSVISEDDACLPTQFHFNARFLCPLSCSTKVMREIKRPVLEIIPPIHWRVHSSPFFRSSP